MELELPVKVLYSAEEIDKTVRSIANHINETYDNLVIIGVLNGSFMFCSDLFKHLTIPCEIDFIQVKSYENNQSTGKLNWLKRPEMDLLDRNVLIVDDIADSGLTLDGIKTELEKACPRSIQTAVLLRRKSCPVEVDYVGFTIESDAYVVGYGLDDNGYQRNLPHLYQK